MRHSCETHLLAVCQLSCRSIPNSFKRSVQFRGVVSPGWDCGSAVANQSVETLTCSTSLAAGRGTTFVVKTAGLLHPGGTVTVTAPGDPVPGNNSAPLAPGIWPLN